MKKCLVEGCANTVDSKGMCKKHYARWTRTGRTDLISTWERIERRLHPEPNTGCWLWSGGTTPDGYGRIRTKGKKKSVHRLVWAHFNGEIPAGLLVLHRCDTPACCNPEHLFLGTQKENMQDCAQKGRLRTQKEKRCEN